MGVLCLARAYPPYHIPQELTLSTQSDSLQDAEAEAEDTGAAMDEEENQVAENVCSAEEEGQPGSTKDGVWPPAQ